MLKSSVLKIIQSFSKEEIAEFNDFLNSPYHNKKSGVVKLYNEVKKYYPDFKDENLDKEKLWSKLYPSKKYSYGVMKNLIHDITKLCEEFIMQKEFLINKLDTNVNLAKALARRNLKELLDSKCSYIEKNYGENKIKDVDADIEDYIFGLEKIYRLKMQYDFHYNHEIDKEDLFKTEDLFITGMLIHLITLSYSSKIYIVYDKEKYDVGKNPDIFLDGIPEETYKNLFDNIKQRSEICHILLHGYRLLYKAYKETENPNDFYKFKEFFFNNFFKLPKSITRDMETSIHNIITLSNFSEEMKNQELYELYVFKKENNMILSFAGNLNAQQFYIFEMILFKCEKLDELKEYLKEFGPHLIDAHKSDSLNFAQSLIAFLEADYEKSLELLSKINFTYYGMKLKVKILNLILLYELNSFESFLSGYDSFKHFLKYTEPENRFFKKAYVEKANIFCNCIKKLFIVKNNLNESELALLKNEVLKNIPEHHSWFEKKISELSLNTTKLNAYSYKKIE